MDVQIVTFPETKVALISHRGSPQTEYDTVRKLIAWKLEKGLLDQARYRQYGLHFADPFASPPVPYRVDFCLSVEDDVEPNDMDIIQAVIPEQRCALARDIGSRKNNQAAAYLYHDWLPGSGEEMSGEPLIFHYVNVGPTVTDSEAITDVYMPLKD